jgi:hypothetical protein
MRCGWKGEGEEELGWDGKKKAGDEKEKKGIQPITISTQLRPLR